MVADACVHSSEEGDFVDDLREVRQEFADVHTGLAVFAKAPRAPQQLEARVGRVVELEVAFELLAVAPC